MTETNKPYKILEEIEVEDNFAVLEITEGNYKGFRYHYEKVKVDEIDDQAVLRFSYNEVCDGNKTTFSEEKEFELEQLLGDILVDIITIYSEEQAIASRAFDTEESNDE